MHEIIIAVFVLGYAAIAFEHPLKVNKTAPALITAGIIWTLYMLMGNHGDIQVFDSETGAVMTWQHFEHVSHSLRHHLGEISEILFFLMGAMTIVEIVDAHQGFKVITNRITTTNQVKLMWVISLVAFFLSSVLDNLTTSIVMVSLLRRLVHDDKQRLMFVGMVVIAANAGGAWSPIGDVTTTMLWIAGRISELHIMQSIFIPSLICLIVPLILASFFMKGEVTRAAYDHQSAKKEEHVRGSQLMFFLGVGGLCFVPAFKILTHLPPYLGMLVSLSVVWVVSELLHLDKTEEERKPYTAIHALSKIDVPSVLFFLGILLAIAGLQEVGLLADLAIWMDNNIGNKNAIALAIGAGSAIVDNVPLVAGAMEMYSVIPTDEYLRKDGLFWEFLAYTAGTGGSMLIIGSAAGVAVMGMEKISFGWYLKHIAWLAAAGYLAGAAWHLIITPLFAG